MRYEIDPDAQRHSDENDINLGQVHSWKFMKAERDVYVLYGEGEWIWQVTPEDRTERVEPFIRELRRVNNT